VRQSLLILLAIAACAAAIPAAQTPTPKKPASKTLTLSGCVQANDSAPNQFTFADDLNPAKATTYRLSGQDMKKYAGRRVEIVGGVVEPRVKIATGLYPSPNVAAQAGAMDPAQAAMASAPGGSASGTGRVELPEFRVKSVKPLDGGCRPQ
jgi:hypothetical protein